MGRTPEAGRPRPRRADRYHHGDLRRALVDEGGRLLEEAGMAGLSLRALARRLGVSHAAPAHHFADREALLCEIAADGFEVLWRGLEEALQGGREGLAERAGLAYVDVALDRPQRFKLMFSSGFMARDLPSERLQEESGRAYLALLRVARGDGPEELPDLATYRMEVPELRTWALVHGATTLFVDGALGHVGDRAGFRALVARMLRDL